MTLNLENAGTATRFLTAAAILAAPGSGPVIIDGNTRMRERPIGELVELLRRMGVRAEYAGREGFPPVRITPPAALDEIATELSVGQTASSQFVSALLLTGIFLPHGLTVRFTSEPTSRSYIEMTVSLLRELGGERRLERGGTLHPRQAHAPLPLRPCRRARRERRHVLLRRRGPGPGVFVLIPGLVGTSMQGDAAFVDLLEFMGARVDRSADGVKVTAGNALLDAVAQDLTLMPDTAMTLAAACCFAPGRSVIGGLKTLRVKETDRLAALVAELTKVGVTASVQGMKSRAGEGAPLRRGPLHREPRGGNRLLR